MQRERACIRAHPYARTHARTHARRHALADLGQTEMEFRLIMQIHVRTRLSIILLTDFAHSATILNVMKVDLFLSLSLSLVY